MRVVFIGKYERRLFTTITVLPKWEQLVRPWFQCEPMAAKIKRESLPYLPEWRLGVLGGGEGSLAEDTRKHFTNFSETGMRGGRRELQENQRGFVCSAPAVRHPPL